MDQVQLLELARQTLSYLTQLIAGGVLAKVGEDGVDDTNALAHRTWEMLRRMVRGSKAAEVALTLYKIKPDDQGQVQMVASEVATLLHQQPQFISEFQVLLAEAQQLGFIARNDHTHTQNIGGSAQIGVATAGDVHGGVTLNQPQGDVVQGYIDNRVINIVLAGNDLDAIITALAHTGMTVDPKLLLESARPKQAHQFFSAFSDLSLSAMALRRAFSKVAPFHKLPDSSERPLLQSILFELEYNTVSKIDHVERFARALLAEPDVTVAQQSVLREWLGLPEQFQSTDQEPGLLIAIDRIPQSDELYHILAWRWPDRLKLWPPVGEEVRSLAASEIPYAVQCLYQSVHHHIAHFGENLRVELMLHHSLLAEPSHEWNITIAFDEDNPGDVVEQPLYIGHSVVVRSVERALSLKSSMVHARALWRTRWSQLPEGCKQIWQRPQQVGAVQHPPFFCPVASEEFAEDLFDQLSSDDYLCFVETIAPPEGIDFIKKVLLRVIRAGIPLGLWFAHNADRKTPIYQSLDGLLKPQHLSELPYLFRQHWKHISLTRPLLFYDDPNRLPYDPDNAAFETPSAA